MFSAISFGVFWRSDPSTSAIIRSMNVSPGRAVMRTTIRSDRTRVPPVTAERSPPASRMTGADSPVIADSSMLAMPSTTSPSLGITSPATTITSSPTSRDVPGDLFDGSVGLRRLAIVSERVRRSVSAWAFPRPSATASAKFANSTVNHRNAATSAVNTFWLVLDDPKSVKKRIVVSTLPTSTTNITGFFMSVRGLSFTKLSPMARRRMGPLSSDVVLRTRSALVSPGVAVGSVIVMKIS